MRSVGRLVPAAVAAGCPSCDVAPFACARCSTRPHVLASVLALLVLVLRAMDHKLLARAFVELLRGRRDDLALGVLGRRGIC